MENPAETHMKAAKRILRYLRGTLEYGMFYSASDKFKLMGYCDTDYARDIDDSKSTTGFIFFLGNNAISWCSKKQPIVTLSTCEAKYVAATTCACHVIWLKILLKELHLEQAKSTKIMMDNKLATALAKNPIFHDRSKHIEPKYHFIRQCIENMHVEVEYVKSLDQVADIFTKTLKYIAFQKLRIMIRVGKIIKFKEKC
ncbi:secreted RxLR effector protein 161-like [Arachis hypogaea]|uniref:secreted RxLR effector protein 161-like n=1 Tax=Arachis hypogaea TaxID=3818 RepID=UPI003B22394B